MSTTKFMAVAAWCGHAEGLKSDDLKALGSPVDTRLDGRYMPASQLESDQPPTLVQGGLIAPQVAGVVPIGGHKRDTIEVKS